MRLVLDTNVLVSGLLQSEGNPARVLTLALAGEVQVCHNREILDEYAEVLARPRFKFDKQRVREVLARLETDGFAVDATGHEDLDLPDADDEPFLAVALAGQVDHLVTGNLVHYPKERRKGCSVVSPSEFVALWKKLHPGVA